MLTWKMLTWKMKTQKQLLMETKQLSLGLRCLLPDIELHIACTFQALPDLAGFLRRCWPGVRASLHPGSSIAVGIVHGFSSTTVCGCTPSLHLDLPFSRHTRAWFLSRYWPGVRASLYPGSTIAVGVVHGFPSTIALFIDGFLFVDGFPWLTPRKRRGRLTSDFF